MHLSEYQTENVGHVLLYAVNGYKGKVGAAGRAEGEEGRTNGRGCKDIGHKSIKKLGFTDSCTCRETLLFKAEAISLLGPFLQF